MDADNRWLEGVTVLDLTRYLAGPSCTRLLVELGADVIKIEQPPYGDPNRSARPRVNRRAGMHVQQNRGKRSLCVDINSDDGREIILELVPHVDVVVENFSPGVMARKGLGYDELSARRPDLIMASVSGFGQTGTMSERPCFDLIAQGFAGIMHMTGEPDGPPTFVGLGMADTNAGVHAFGAIGHALFHRERTGRGTHLDIAMVDALFHMHETNVHAATMDPDYVPHRQGRHFQPLSPAGAFRSPEGWIIILCTQDQVGNLFDAVGQPELMDDPRFAGNPQRLEHRDLLTAIIEDWMAGFDCDEDVLAVLSEHRVPSGPVLSPADAITHPHFVERGLIRWVDDPLAGRFAIPGFPLRSTDPFPADDHPTPALGEHNHAVLADMLGYDETRIADLESSGVLGAKPH